MAKSLMQIRSSIENQLRGGFQVDDDKFDEDLINDMIHDTRSVLLEWYHKKYRYFNDQFYQDICCLQIYCHDITCVVDGVTYETGVSEYRVNLPDLFQIGGEVFVRFLGSVDFKTAASRRTLLGNLYANGNLHTQEAFSYVLHEEYATLENLPTDGMKFICISAITQDPMELECVRLTEEDDYPIPDILVAKLEMMVLERLEIALGKNPNQPNNAIDDGQVHHNSKRQPYNKRINPETVRS